MSVCRYGNGLRREYNMPSYEEEEEMIKRGEVRQASPSRRIYRGHAFIFIISAICSFTHLLPGA
jgi:hypothetical protein